MRKQLVKTVGNIAGIFIGSMMVIGIIGLLGLSMYHLEKLIGSPILSLVIYVLIYSIITGIVSSIISSKKKNKEES